MGGTSKANQSNLAGVHGEGLKVALLILLREPQNHGVICRSGGFIWRFNFSNQGKLFTTLTRMTEAAMTKAQGKANEENGCELRPFAPDPNKDVQFVIGGPGNGRDRDDRGYPTNRSEVTKEEFKNWTKAAIFLQEIYQQHFLRTDKGDLITDERFSGSIYLKGLILKQSKPGRSASLTGYELKYGYNFAAGTTNRERESMAATGDETRAILSIWDRALSLESSPTSLIQDLHNLLNSRDKYADVAKPEKYISKTTAHRLKEYLVAEPRAKNWYHSARETNQVCTQIY